MKIAFDLDGTLGRYPIQLGEMAKSLQETGHDVFVLTAAAGEHPPENRPDVVRGRLRAIGLGFLNPICVEEIQKANYCDQNGVDILIDDKMFKTKKTILLQVA